MAKFNVVDMNGQHVSEIEFPTPCSVSPRTKRQSTLLW